MNNNSSQRKTRDKSKKRNSILDAAIKAYQLHGYYNSSMDSIAEIAGASKRTVYNHFESKELLFDAVISRYLFEQEKISDFVFSNEVSIYEQLSKIADSEIFLIENEQNRALSKVLTSVFLFDNDLATKIRQKYRTRIKHIYQWFEDAKRENALNIKDVNKEVNVFITMIQGHITWPSLFAKFDKQDIEDKKKEILNRYISTVIKKSCNNSIC